MPPGEYFLNEIACYRRIIPLVRPIPRRSSPSLFPFDSPFSPMHRISIPATKYRKLVSHGYVSWIISISVYIYIYIYIYIEVRCLVNYTEIEKVSFDSTQFPSSSLDNNWRKRGEMSRGKIDRVTVCRREWERGGETYFWVGRIVEVILK